jgi:tetratricopeptide (TPR) repeat protein
MNHNEQKLGQILEPFEDRIDILFKEIELAIRWQRPSILLAIYGSEYVYSDAATSLENQLRSVGRQVEYIHGRDGVTLDIVRTIGATEDLENTIFFVDGLRWVARGDSWGAYRSLNQSREFFVSKRIRIVFWLTEDEASSLARFAPDYWAFRHRVVEFIESPDPEQILLRALQSTWQIAGEDTDTYEDPDGKIALRYAMLEELPDNTESTGMRANLLLSLGILHWRKGILDKAARLLNEALGISSTVGEPWLQAACYNAIAIVQADQGLIDDAIASYQKAIALTPNEIFPWNNLGNLYERLNRCEEAIEAFEQALANNERDALAWNGLGNVYLRQQRTADAISAYNKSITIAPDFAYPWNGLGNAFASMGDFDAAIGAYQAAVELNKDFPTPWVNLGDIFQEQGNNQDALKAYWNAVRIDSKNAQIWNSLGNAYFFSNQYEEAIQAYLKAIKLNRGQEVSYRNLAVAYARLGRHDESMACYQKSLELGGEAPLDAAEETSSLRPSSHTYQELVTTTATAEQPDRSEPVSMEEEDTLADDQVEGILNTLNAELAPAAHEQSVDAEELLPVAEFSDALEEDEEDLPLIETPYPLDGLQPFVGDVLVMSSMPVAPAADAMIEAVILTPAPFESVQDVSAGVCQPAVPEVEPVNSEVASEAVMDFTTTLQNPRFCRDRSHLNWLRPRRPLWRLRLPLMITPNVCCAMPWFGTNWATSISTWANTTKPSRHIKKPLNSIPRLVGVTATWRYAIR